ncbi:hypothetical protein Vafri_13395 [Volvox africanus]|nr:hypothetical protein Vafri_13395 [Volvox africanus]
MNVEGSTGACEMAGPYTGYLYNIDSDEEVVDTHIAPVTGGIAATEVDQHNTDNADGDGDGDGDGNENAQVPDDLPDMGPQDDRPYPYSDVDDEMFERLTLLSNSSTEDLDGCLDDILAHLARASLAHEDMAMPANASCACGREDCKAVYFKPGSAEWYKAHMEQPVLYGMNAEQQPVRSDVSTRELVIALLELHVTHHVGSGVMDVLLQLFSRVVPGVHFIPPSVHILRQISETPNHMTFQRHVCSASGCPGHVYESLPDRHTWGDNLDQRCPHCGTNRFRVVQMGGRSIVEPTFPFHYIGAEAALGELFTNPTFCKERGQKRDVGPGSNGSSMYKGEAMAHLRKECPEIKRKDHSTLELMVDWFQPFKTSYSIGVVGGRVSDVEARNRGKSYGTVIFSIIPGPSQPGTMTPYLRPLVSELSDLAMNGMDVLQPELSSQPFRWHPVCWALLADSPARSKCANLVGLARNGACAWCSFEGVYISNTDRLGGAVRFFGYDTGVPQMLGYVDIWVQVIYGSEADI